MLAQSPQAAAHAELAKILQERIPADAGIGRAEVVGYLKQLSAAGLQTLVAAEKFTIVLDENGRFVDEPGARATLFEAFGVFEAGREASIEVVAQSLVQLCEEMREREGENGMTPAKREELVKMRRRIRSIEVFVKRIEWCLGVVARDGSLWHFGEPDKLFAAADQIVATLVSGGNSRSGRELTFHKVDVFSNDFECGGSFTVVPEEKEALLSATKSETWGEFVSIYRGWNPIFELPTMLWPMAFASMILAVDRYTGPNPQDIERTLRDGTGWGFGPG